MDLRARAAFAFEPLARGDSASHFVLRIPVLRWQYITSARSQMQIAGSEQRLRQGVGTTAVSPNLSPAGILARRGRFFPSPQSFAECNHRSPDPESDVAKGRHRFSGGQL